MEDINFNDSDWLLAVFWQLLMDDDVEYLVKLFEIYPEIVTLVEQDIEEIIL